MARTERKFLVIYSLLAVTMFVCVTYLPHGHDMNFHVYRIGSIADNLRQNGLGGFPYRIYMTSFYGRGYGAPLFYGDIFLYLPALLACIVKDAYLSYKIFVSAIPPLAFIAMYGCVRSLHLFADSRANRDFAVLAAVFYVYSPGFMENLWIRAAVGEALAGIFLPVVFCMIYKITMGQDWKFCHVLWLSVGISGLILSHVITTIIVAFFSVIFLALHVKRLCCEPVRVGGLLLGGLLALCLTAYWTLPFLEQYRLINLTDGSLSPDFYASETVKWRYWLIPYELYGRLTDILNIESADQWGPSAIGYGAISMLYMICRYHRDIERKEILQYGIFAFVVLVLISIKPFNQWTCAKLPVNKIQFPWRLLVMIFFLIALTLSYILVCLNKKNLMIMVSTITLVTAAIPTALLYRNAYTEMSLGTSGCAYSPNAADNLYLPAEVDRDEIRSGEGNVVSNNDISYEISRNTGSFHILVTENKHADTVLKNDTGDIVICYRGTPLQKICNYISAVSVALLCLYVGIRHTAKTSPAFKSS